MNFGQETQYDKVAKTYRYPIEKVRKGHIFPRTFCWRHELLKCVDQLVETIIQVDVIDINTGDIGTRHTGTRYTGTRCAAVKHCSS